MNCPYCGIYGCSPTCGDNVRSGVCPECGSGARIFRGEMRCNDPQGCGYGWAPLPMDGRSDPV